MHYEFAARAIMWLIAIVLGSVVWDHFTYERRQDQWEKDHPGATYIRGYKRSMRRADKAQQRARKMGGQV